MSQELEICGDCIKHIDGNCIGEEGFILSYRPWWAMLRGECTAKVIHQPNEEKDT